MIHPESALPVDDEDDDDGDGDDDDDDDDLELLHHGMYKIHRNSFRRRYRPPTGHRCGQTSSIPTYFRCFHLANFTTIQNGFNNFTSFEQQFDKRIISTVHWTFSFSCPEKLDTTCCPKLKWTNGSIGTSAGICWRTKQQRATQRSAVFPGRLKEAPFWEAALF